MRRFVYTLVVSLSNHEHASRLVLRQAQDERHQGMRLALIVTIALALGGFGDGQGLDPAALQKPAVDAWPTYHGDYSGQRHSPLTHITPENVSQLTLAWAFQTGQSASIKSTPIVVNGMLYVSAPDQLWAIDARTARQVWQYRYPDNTGFHIGHVSIAGALMWFDYLKAAGRGDQTPWRPNRPALAAWYEQVIKRPSFQKG